MWKDLIAKLKTEFPVTITMPKAPEPKPEAPVAPAAEPAAKPEAGK